MKFEEHGEEKINLVGETLLLDTFAVLNADIS